MSVFFYGCITIDGYLADKNHNLEWLHQIDASDVTGYDDFYQRMDITVMGKRTFDEIAKTDGAENVYPTTENYVFTHKETLAVDGYVPISGDIIDFIGNFDKNKNIWIVGGNQLLAPLLNNDLVDTMIIQIAPVLLGSGIPLFTQKDDLKQFSLEAVKQYGHFAEIV